MVAHTSKRSLIRGSGKGGGGQPVAPKEDANDLRSKSYARVLDLLGWGEWEGLVRSNTGTSKTCDMEVNNPHIGADTTGLSVGMTVSGPGIQVGTTIISIDGSGTFFSVDLLPVVTNTEAILYFNASTGAESIYLDETPLQSFVDGSWVTNFSGVKWAFTPGTQDQGHLPGFDTVENFVSVNVKVRKISAVTRSITNSDADKCIVEVRLPRLYRQTETGDVIRHSVNVQLFVRLNGGSYTLVKDWVIYGKCVTDYLESTEFTLPKSSTPESDTWDIKLERVTADHDGNSKMVDEIYFNSYTEVVTRKFRYPNMAMVALEVDAENFSQIPRRAFHVKMRKIQVPTNYDPEARTYATTGPGTTGGGWDGTFKVAYSNNPAWVSRDICINKNFGIGRYIDLTRLDKWTLYDIAQYCDVMVPDGKGGTEPRFVANFYLQTQAEALKVLSDVASIGRMIIYYGRGSLNFVQDRPKDSFTAFTNSDVKDGTFNYPSTSLTARKSVIHVRFNDPDDFYRPKIQPYEDYEAIFRYGYHEIEVMGFGIAGRGQAFRYGAHLANTERLESEGISFIATQRGHLVRVGQILDIFDERRQQVENGGKVLSSSSTSSVTLDKPVLIEASKTYTLTLVVPKALSDVEDITNSTQTATIETSQLEEKTVNTSPGTVSTLTVSSAFSSVPTGATWILTSNTLAAQKMRVISVEEQSPTEFLISGNRYNVTKFDETEVDPNFELPPVLYYPDSNRVPPVENLTLTPRTVVVAGEASTWLDIGWSSPSTYRYHSSFRVAYSYENGPFIQLTEVFSPGHTFRMEAPGTYIVRVTAVSSINRATSVPTQATYTLGNVNPRNKFTITGLELTDQGNDYAFSGRDARFSWRLNSPTQAQEIGSETNGAQAGSTDPFFNHYLIQIINSDGVVVFEDRTLSPHYTYTFEQNRLHGTSTNAAPYRAFTFRVYAIDKYNTKGIYSQITVSNPAPSLPTVDAQPLLDAVNFKFSFPQDTDFRGYRIWASTTSGFTPADENLVYDGPDSQPTIKLSSADTWYYKYGAYDAFGTAGMTISAELTANPSSIVDTVAPAIPSNVALTSALIQNEDGSQFVQLTGSWDANTEDDFAAYIWRIKEVAASPFSWVYGTAAGVDSTSVTFQAKHGTAYEIQVSAIDTWGNQSDFSSSATHTSVADTVAPNNPTNIVVTAGMRILVLTWDNSSSDNLASVNIYRNTTNTFPGGTPYATESAIKDTKGSFVDTNVTQGTTYYYFFKAVNRSGTEAATETTSVNGSPGQVQNVDLADFAVGLTKMFSATLALSGDSWTDNSPAAGRIAWNAHTLYYQGASYSISSGSTPSSSHRYVYWDSASPTTYQTSTTNPTLTDSQFMIATNLNGAHDLAWNAMANILVRSAHIESLEVTKLTSGTIEAQTIVIGSASNPTNSIIQSYNFSSGSAGWRIRGNGDAELNNVTVRNAVIVSGTLSGTDVGTVTSGANRALAAIDGSNNLVTAFAPSTSAPVSGSGLFMGSDAMGYYSGGAWKTYMDNSGNFYLGGTGGALLWNAGTSTLTIQGNSNFKGVVDIGSGNTRTLINSSYILYGDLGGRYIQQSVSGVATHITVSSSAGYCRMNTDEINGPQISIVAGGNVTALLPDMLFLRDCSIERVSAGVLETGGMNFSGQIQANGGVVISGTFPLTFSAAGSTATIDEDWGVNLNGDSTHPIQIPNASLAVGFNSSGSNLSTGRIYFGSTSIYLHVSGGKLWLNDGTGDRALT